MTQNLDDSYHSHDSNNHADAPKNASGKEVQETVVARLLQEDNKPRQGPTNREVGGAAVMGGLVGWVMGGPFVALVGAGGTAAVATTETKVGKLARKGGEKMACAGDQLVLLERKHRLIERGTNQIRSFDQKHQIVEKTSNRLRDINERHRLVEQATYRLRNLNQKHNIIEKTSNGVVKGCNWLAKHLENPSASGKSQIVA